MWDVGILLPSKKMQGEGTDRQTDTDNQTDIADTRLNRPMGRFSEKYLSLYTKWKVFSTGCDADADNVSNNTDADKHKILLILMMYLKMVMLTLTVQWLLISLLKVVAAGVVTARGHSLVVGNRLRAGLGTTRLGTTWLVVSLGEVARLEEACIRTRRDIYSQINPFA